MKVFKLIRISNIVSFSSTCKTIKTQWILWFLLCVYHEWKRNNRNISLEKKITQSWNRITVELWRKQFGYNKTKQMWKRRTRNKKKSEFCVNNLLIISFKLAFIFTHHYHSVFPHFYLLLNQIIDDWMSLYFNLNSNQYKFLKHKLLLYNFICK